MSRFGEEDKILGMDSYIPFGQYKDGLISDILADDPEYLLWVAENTEYEFDEEVLNAL